MKTRSQACNRADKLNAFSTHGPGSAARTPPGQRPFPASAGNQQEDAQPSSIQEDGRYPEHGIPSPFPPAMGMGGTPTSPSDAWTAGRSSEGMAQTNPLYPDQSAHHPGKAAWPPRGPSFAPLNGGFTAYDGQEHAAYGGGHVPGAGARAEEGPVSPLHISLIVMILLAGLVLGIGRSWWIDEQLEAAVSKESAMATLPAATGLEDASSSIQSSIDRAYIPPTLDPDSGDMEEKEQVANLEDKTPVPAEALEPDAALQSPGAAPLSKVNPSAPSKTEQAQSSKEPPGDEVKVAGSSAADHDNADAGKAKQHKSAKAASSRKTASSDKRQGLSEIDRVRAQAFSETSKDRVGRRKSAPSGTSIGPQSERRESYRANKVAQRVVTKSQYARCERIDHIIRREQCKWELCNNKWGKGACPSFNNDKPFLF